MIFLSINSYIIYSYVVRSLSRAVAECWTEMMEMALIWWREPSKLTPEVEKRSGARKGDRSFFGVGKKRGLVLFCSTIIGDGSSLFIIGLSLGLRQKRTCPLFLLLFWGKKRARKGDCAQKLGKGERDVESRSETFHRNPTGGKPVQ